MKKTVKHFILGVSVLALVGLAANEVSAATPTSILEARTALRAERIQKKLAIIQEKAGVEVKNHVAEKIKIKEEKIAAKKEAAAEKKAAAEQAKANQATANQAVTNQAATNETTPQTSEVTSGASQTGREIGETNRAYGKQLSNPDLTQSERQAIIQEKKAYNRSRR